MSFSGFKRPEDHGKGGVSRIRLLPVSDLSGCELNDSSDAVARLTLRDNSSFAEMQFVEHSASFRQTASGNYPLVSVVHELSFDIARNDHQSLKTLQLLSDFGKQGFAALVTLNSGTVFLAGWSPTFGTECPLIPDSLSSLSGNAPQDDPYCRISLRSRDDSFALPFDGTL